MRIAVSDDDAIELKCAGSLAETSLRFYLGGDTSGGFETVVLDSLNAAP